MPGVSGISLMALDGLFWVKALRECCWKTSRHLPSAAERDVDDLPMISASVAQW
jgi:hypothetical protein